MTARPTACASPSRTASTWQPCPRRRAAPRSRTTPYRPRRTRLVCRACARIVGKANLHELCFGATGVNPWYGTPVNPLDPARVPGGSSSGSTVAVVSGEADVGIGTDTTGSVRTPAACCGAVGLRTTFGRIPLDGIQPLAPSLDTVGPIGRDVDWCARGMALLDPEFAPV